MSIWLIKEKLPSKEKFYSSLTGKNNQWQGMWSCYFVWNKFGMKTMKGYHDLYFKYGVLLLADIFEKFRSNSLKNYELFPSHYLSAPGLSWDAMLKMRKVKLDFIIDPYMYIFFEKSGICYIYNWYSKASDKSLKYYDAKEESKHIIYIDANNLHGCAMSKFLPTSGFKWIDPKEFDLNKYTSNSSIGCIFEVDL